MIAPTVEQVIERWNRPTEQASEAAIYKNVIHEAGKVAHLYHTGGGMLWWIENEIKHAIRALSTTPAEPVCPTCRGNDGDMPCAYPSKGMKGCLRDQRLQTPDCATTPSAQEAHSAITVPDGREQFEEWHDKAFPAQSLMRHIAGYYADHSVNNKWKAWEMSRTSLAASPHTVNEG
jgi:hypothetical protein